MLILSEVEPANPYAPPNAIVADIPPPLADSRCPPSVLWAVRLLWVAVAFGALFIAFRPLPPMPPGMPPLGARAIGLLVLVPWSWLVLKIAAGRNWARLTWIVITVLGLLSTLISPEKLTRLGPLGQASFTLQTTLQLAAFVLLVSPRARRWFKPPVSPSSGDPP
ncbi:MAG: hypothetical protein JSR66_33960 [Proteobacteria bacterium]|nr:hypothetical protein [Pseudomonadota bacterium]